MQSDGVEYVRADIYAELEQAVREFRDADDALIAASKACAQLTEDNPAEYERLEQAEHDANVRFDAAWEALRRLRARQGENDGTDSR
jgi:hypothetical protein